MPSVRTHHPSTRCPRSRRRTGRACAGATSHSGHSARAALGQPAASPRRQLAVGLFDRPPLGSMSGVILTSTTPRRVATSPTRSQCSRSGRRVAVGFVQHGDDRREARALVEPASPPVPLRKIGRKHNEYVVPTSKRRDDLVWQTRMRMRQRTRTPTAWRCRRAKVVRICSSPLPRIRRDDLRWRSVLDGLCELRRAMCLRARRQRGTSWRQ